jgi:hypothetical protein
MAKAFKIARTDESELYVPRIQGLLEAADLRGARKLLAEALAHGSSESGLKSLERLLAPPRQELRPASDFDRSAEIRWLDEHATEYRGQWVALLGNELLAHGTLDEVTAELKATPPRARALLHRIH